MTILSSYEADEINLGIESLYLSNIYLDPLPKEDSYSLEHIQSSYSTDAKEVSSLKALLNEMKIKLHSNNVSLKLKEKEQMSLIEETQKIEFILESLKDKQGTCRCNLL